MLIVIAWTAACCSHVPAREAGFPLVKTFSSADIGADAMGWVTVQEADGTLLFGCNALVSYDGERWRTAPIGNAYALRGLELGEGGRLWAAATGDIGWFERAPGGAWSFHSLRPQLPAEYADMGAVWYVFAEDEGAVFVSENGIFRWDGKKFHCWPMRGARRPLAFRSGGIIYVHHVPAGLYALEAGGPRKIIPAEELGGAAIFGMEAQDDGWLLATSKGLFNYARGGLTPFAPEASEFLRREALTCVRRLPDGRLALGTFRGGIALVRQDGTLDRILTESDGLPTRAIYSLFSDRDGGLWVTSPSHIFRVAVGSPAAVFDNRAGLPAQPCFGIVRNEGRITAATDSGLYEMQADEMHFRAVDALRERPWDLRSTSRGLLVATSRDVRLLAGGRSEVIYASGLEPFAVRVSQSVPASVLISAGRSIVLAEPGRPARTLVRDLPDIVTSITEDRAGNLWLGTTTRGILFARPDPAAPVEAVPAAGTRRLPAGTGWGFVVATPDGALLAFAPGGGWVKGPEADAFEPIADFPRRGVAVASNPDAEGNVWIVHPDEEGIPASVARIAVREGHATWQAHLSEGLAEIGKPRAILAEGSAAAGSAVLWIGGEKGILRSAVDGGPVAPAPRRPLLRAFARGADDDTLRPVTGVLPYATRAVLFEFAAGEFSHRTALRLETRVDGIDRGWVPAGPAAQREFTAVRDGAYTFRVRAVAGTGVAGEAAAFSFAIAPPWWRTAPALLAAFAAVAAAAYGVLRLRMSALRRRNAELEHKVRERTAQLAQASAAKTQFVANMSHDIRNPLNGIVGLALALEDTRLDPGQREIVATLRECTTYLSSLVDDVLDFASIEAGRVELRPGPVVPAELLRSVAATLRAEARQRGAAIAVEVAPDVPATVLGDAGRIQQILVNYVTNALKYAGGDILLSAGVPAGAPGEIEFAVTDAGPGLNEAEQRVLFTKFTRLPSASGEQIEGAGLGLASCRLLAGLMGGAVGVASRAGHGARFFLRLPLAVLPPPAEPAAAFIPPPQCRVLVVEDTDYNAWAAAAVLARLGLTHVRARSGGEALRLFSEEPFNIVLLDRNLPDMDGTEVARRMRKMEADGPRAVLLAVTAYCTAADRALCLEAGMSAFVGKPLTPEKLRKALIAAGRQLLTAASVEVPAEPPAAAADLALLGYLGDGTEEGLEAEVGRFLAALKAAESELMQAAAAGDPRALGDAAHLVQSQARLVGGGGLETAALALEQACRAGQPAGTAGLLARVRGEISELTAALRNRPAAAHSA